MTAEEKHWEEGLKTHEKAIQTVVSITLIRVVIYYVMPWIQA
jgi:hypothetical protein